MLTIIPSSRSGTSRAPRRYAAGVTGSHTGTLWMSSLVLFSEGWGGEPLFLWVVDNGRRTPHMQRDRGRAKA